MQQGIINKGDFSGVSIDKTQKYRKVQQWVETRAGYTEPAGRGITDDWEPEHWVGAEGYHHDVQVPDGFTKTTCITSSKRADIRQETGVLVLAQETINQEALQNSYKAALSTNPVKDVLGAVLGAETTKSLTDAFNAVRALKPLSIEDALDNRKIKALQTAHAEAVAGVKNAVKESGIIGILQKTNVQALVKTLPAVWIWECPVDINN